MARYEINTQLNGIEIYFDEKPSEDILQELRDNHWRWHRSKRCWYNRKSEETFQFAQELCKPAPMPKLTPSLKSTAPEQIPSHEVSYVTYRITTNGETCAHVTITKCGNQFKVSSTNNQLVCCDCHRMFSIHAPSCPSCGCPISYILENDFNEITQKQLLERQKEAEEQRRREAEERKRKEAEEKQREEEERKRKEAEKRKREEEERKRREAEEKWRKEEERKRKEAEARWQSWLKENEEIVEKENQKRKEEIERICSLYDINDSIVEYIYQSGVSVTDLKNRIRKILYYSDKYPYLEIELESFIKVDSERIDNYVEKNKKESKNVVCTGICSNCNREKCLMA